MTDKYSRSPCNLWSIENFLSAADSRKAARSASAVPDRLLFRHRSFLKHWEYLWIRSCKSDTTHGWRTKNRHRRDWWETSHHKRLHIEPRLSPTGADCSGSWRFYRADGLCGQNCNNGYYDQKFDKSENMFFALHTTNPCFRGTVCKITSIIMYIHIK